MREQRPTGSAKRGLKPDRPGTASDDRGDGNYSELNGDRRPNREATGECRCEVRFRGVRLVLDVTACPGSGRLAASPACRERVIGALSAREAKTVRVRAATAERACRQDATAFLVAAGRFVALCGPHDAALAARARGYPLEVARVAAGRGEPIARIAAETGFIGGSVRFASYQEVFGDLGEGGERGAPGDR